MGRENAIAIEVFPTGAALGADVRGMDLSVEFDAAVFQQIYRAWNDHLVLRFQDQRLDDGALVAFSRRFGGLDMAPTPVRRRGPNVGATPHRVGRDGGDCRAGSCRRWPWQPAADA
jgi:alpha-ketoglutarate-dependent taurine dioxygenase